MSGNEPPSSAAARTWPASVSSQGSPPSVSPAGPNKSMWVSAVKSPLGEKVSITTLG